MEQNFLWLPKLETILSDSWLTITIALTWQSLVHHCGIYLACLQISLHDRVAEFPGYCYNVLLAILRCKNQYWIEATLFFIDIRITCCVWRVIKKKKTSEHSLEHTGCSSLVQIRTLLFTRKKMTFFFLGKGSGEQGLKGCVLQSCNTHMSQE